MRPEWIDAVKRAWERDRGRASVAVQRNQLPMPARDAWDQLEKEPVAAGTPGAARKTGAVRFSVEGKNVFAVTRPDDAGALRVHLYDAAGHLVASGESDEGGSRWIGRN